MQCAVKHKGIMTQGHKNSEVFLDFRNLGTYPDNPKYLHLCLSNLKLSVLIIQETDQIWKQMLFYTKNLSALVKN